MRHERISTNGVTLHAAIEGKEDGPLIILLHGFPELWYGWKAQIPFLAERGYLVVAPDQRGYNESDKPKGVAPYALDELAKDIIGIIDALGRKKAIVVGHDWGGAVAWWLAVFHPDRVERMVSLNMPHPAVMRRYLFRNLTQMRKSWYVFFFQLPRFPERSFTKDGGESISQMMADSARPGTFAPEDLVRYREAWMKPGALTAMINWYRAMRYAILKRVDKDLGRVRMPVLLIWGRHDPILGEEMAPPSIALCDHGRLELIEASHWVQHEEPARVNSLLAEFLA